jgi:hypothetical protein
MRQEFLHLSTSKSNRSRKVARQSNEQNGTGIFPEESLFDQMQ